MTCSKQNKEFTGSSAILHVTTIAFFSWYFLSSGLFWPGAYKSFNPFCSLEHQMEFESRRSFNQLFINDPTWTWLPRNTHMDRNVFQNGLVLLQISAVNLAWFRLLEQTATSSTGETGACRQAPVHLPMCQQKSGLTWRSFLESHMHASGRTGHVLRRWKNNKRARLHHLFARLACVLDFWIK